MLYLSEELQHPLVGVRHRAGGDDVAAAVLVRGGARAGHEEVKAARLQLTRHLPEELAE